MLIRKRCLVFIICKNCVESISGYLGVFQSGAVPVLLNETINRLQLEKLIEKYRPAYIFLPSIKNKTILNKTIIDTIGSYDFCKTGLDQDYNIHYDLALLLTTSGSTGSPKFVRQSYKNILSNAKSISKVDFPPRAHWKRSSILTFAKTWFQEIAQSVYPERRNLGGINYWR